MNCLNQLHEQAAAILAASVQPASCYVQVSTSYCTRFRTLALSLAVFDLAAGAGELLLLVQADTAELALAQLGAALGVAYPLAVVALISVEQKETIIRLLNHPLIERQEKTKTLLNYNLFTDERAARCIAKLRAAIEARENRPCRVSVEEATAAYAAVAA